MAREDTDTLKESLYFLAYRSLLPSQYRISGAEHRTTNSWVLLSIFRLRRE